MFARSLAPCREPNYAQSISRPVGEDLRHRLTGLKTLSAGRDARDHAVMSRSDDSLTASAAERAHLLDRQSQYLIATAARAP